MAMATVSPSLSAFNASWYQHLHRCRIKVFQWYGFLMAFPAIVIFQNISVFLLPFVLLEFRKRFGYFFKLRHIIQIVSILFATGAMMSLINMPIRTDEAMGRAIEVLPNYLYWAVLIFFLISHYKNILYSRLYKAIALGVACTIIYFFVLQPLGIRSLMIFKSVTPNTFAFIIIIFSPILSQCIM
jgi:hypothetical protein